MKEEIIKIAEKLKNYEITEKDAHTQLLKLLEVTEIPKPKCRMPDGEFYYRPHGGGCRILNCEYFY